MVAGRWGMNRGNQGEGLVMDPQTRKRQWHSGLVSPQMWAVTSAPALMHAAKVLWNRFRRASDLMQKAAVRPDSVKTKPRVVEFGLSTVAFMLVAFAVENLLKGIWVKRMESERPLVEGDRRIRDIFSTHKLSTLATKAGIPCDAGRLELLDRLSTELLWGGRYPRPIRAEDFFPTVFGRPDQVKMRHFHPNDWEPIVDLYNELYLTLRPTAVTRSRTRRSKGR